MVLDCMVAREDERVDIRVEKVLLVLFDGSSCGAGVVVSVVVMMMMTNAEI